MAETAYVNGVVHTMDRARPRAEALLVRGNRIAAIGRTAHILELAGRSARVVDLAGKFVMPSFTDAHLHFIWGANYLDEVGLRDARSMAQVREKLRDYAAAFPERPWILGKEFSYGYPDLPESGFDRALLDDIVPDRPVYFRSGMAHAAWANSRALEIAGIDRHTPDPENGRIMRRPDGEPSGWLVESASDLIGKVVPAPDEGQLGLALQAGMKEANRLGIGRVQSGGFDDDMVPILAGLAQDNLLTLRFSLGSILDPGADAAAVVARVGGWRASLDSEFLDGLAVKFFLDGVLESHTGYVPEGYADKPGETGMLLWDIAAYEAAVRQVQEAGLQVWTHAIGTGASMVALDAYEKDGERSRRLRPRVEHCEVPDARDIARFSRIGAVASMQPAMIYPKDQWLGMEGLWERRMGPERLARAFPLRSLLDAGAALAFGTDWPIVDFNPLTGIRNAVLRRSRDHEPAGGWVAEQAVTLEEAVHAYTLGAAYAGHRDHEEGSLEVSKLADFIVLSDNIFAINVDAIADTDVLMTVIGGAQVS